MLGNNPHPKAAFRALKLIYYALNTGLLLFFLVGIYLNDMAIPEFKDGVDILTLVNVLLLGMIPIGNVISGRKLAAIEAGDPFARKFEQFQSAMILRWAMIEGVALFSVVGLIVLQDGKQMVLFVICILILSLNTVNKEKMIKLAKLTPEEALLLEE
ncbi:MAG: hypothetical protein QNK35_14905 [Bacteroides sp.]|nr:hypothetical protein [Bacteroides sp.]